LSGVTGCGGSWEYSWCDGKKCWDGSGFNSNVGVWQASFSSITVSNVSQPATYIVRVRCTANHGCYSESKVDISGYSVIFQDDFESDKGWVLTGEFQRDKPKGLGGKNLNADPLAAHSGQYVIGTDLTGLGVYKGDYEANLANRAYTAVSPLIDCSMYRDVSLEFYRWLNIYGKMGPFWYGAFIDVTNDNGKTWIMLFSLEQYYQLNGYQDKQWWQMNKANCANYKPNFTDLSKYADGKSQVRIRFGLGPSEGVSDGLFCSGWNIDDFRLVGNMLVSCTPPDIIAKANGYAGELIYCSRAGGETIMLSADLAASGSGCNGNWTYSWFNGSKYWDGLGFNSSSEVFNISYRNISVISSLGSTDYTVKVKCNGSADCKSSGSVNVTAMTSGSGIVKSVGKPSNGAEHHISLSWNPLPGVSYELDYSPDGINNWQKIYEGTSSSFDHNTGDKPDVPFYYRVRNFKKSVTCDWNYSPSPKYTACDSPLLLITDVVYNSLKLSFADESPVPNPPYSLFSVKCLNNGLFVQQDGKFGNNEYFATKAAWGKISISDLNQETEYCFVASAKNSDGDITSVGVAGKECALTPRNVPVVLDGHITYDNPKCSPVYDSKVFLINSDGMTVDSSYTDTAGYYRFMDVLGGIYKVRCSTMISWGGSDPLDALLVNKYFIGLFSFQNFLRQLASDVSFDSKVNPIDALMINKRFVNAISCFKSPDWLFESNQVSVIGKDVTFDIKAVCYGDVNASYSFK
jgi:hypothetical protein